MADQNEGIIVVFEGISGAGKTIQAIFLEKALKDAGYSTLWLSLPRDNLKNDFDWFVIAYL